jgi:hypothetical protein
MSIVKATKAFVVEIAGAHHEVHTGDHLASSHPTVEAYPKRFEPASDEEVAAAVERARGR